MKSHSSVQRFSAAASQYAHHARIQRRAASQLWQGLSLFHANGLPQFNACIDVGCGTGFMTEQLLNHCHNTPVHAIDTAPGMLQLLKNQCTHSMLHTHLMDGTTLKHNTLGLKNPVLLVSNLCAQWFKYLEPALNGWFTLADTLAFSVVLSDSFTPWRNACETAGEPCGLRRMPTMNELQHWLHGIAQHHPNARCMLNSSTLLDHHPNALSFVKSLKAIGADTPAPHHRPARLHRVFAELNGPITMNYHIGFVYVAKCT